MPQHAYIDESGTMDHQDVMTVAAVVFEGAHSAVNLHNHIMRDLNPNYVGAVRDHHRGLTAAHEYIKHQVVSLETYTMPAVEAKER